MGDVTALMFGSSLVQDHDNNNNDNTVVEDREDDLRTVRSNNSMQQYPAAHTAVRVATPHIAPKQHRYSSKDDDVSSMSGNGTHSDISNMSESHSYLADTATAIGVGYENNGTVTSSISNHMNSPLTNQITVIKSKNDNDDMSMSVLMASVENHPPENNQRNYDINDYHNDYHSDNSACSDNGYRANTNDITVNDIAKTQKTSSSNSNFTSLKEQDNMTKKRIRSPAGQLHAPRATSAATSGRCVSKSLLVTPPRSSTASRSSRTTPLSSISSQKLLQKEKAKESFLRRLNSIKVNEEEYNRTRIASIQR